MNTKVNTNKTLDASECLPLGTSRTTLRGYQELKLLNIHHRDGGYHVLGPLPITPEAESALRLWLPSLDPDFLHLHDFSYLGIRSALAFRFFWELFAVWRGHGGAAITLEDALQALNNAEQPGRPIVLRWGAEARFGGASGFHFPVSNLDDSKLER